MWDSSRLRKIPVVFALTCLSLASSCTLRRNQSSGGSSTGGSAPSEDTVETQPVATGPNIVASYYTARARCGFNAESSPNTYAITCRVAAIQPNGDEAIATSFAPTLSATWQPIPIFVSGPPLSSINCTVTPDQLTQQCTAVISTPILPAVLAPTLNLTDSVLGNTTSSDIIDLPFQILPIGHVIPVNDVIPLTVASSSPALAAHKFGSMLDLSFVVNGVKDLAAAVLPAGSYQGLQNQPIDNPNVWKTPTGIKFFQIESTCSMNGMTYFTSGAMIYQTDGTSLSLYAGSASPLVSKNELFHRLRLHFSQDISPAYEPRLACNSATGNLIVMDAHRILNVPPSGTVTLLVTDETLLPSPIPSTSPAPLAFSNLALSPDNQSIYIVDALNNKIRKLVPSANAGEDPVFISVAGSTPGYTGDGGQALNAQLSSPRSIAVGSDSSIYFTDGYAIRKIDPQGVIQTIAGNYAQSGDSGDGGPATQALLENVVFPLTTGASSGLAVGSDNTVYLADTRGGKVRAISPTGTISSLPLSFPSSAGAATFTGPMGVQTSPNGTLLVTFFPWSIWGASYASAPFASIWNVSTTGAVATPIVYYPPGTTTDPSQFSTIQGVAMADANTSYVADRFSYQIRKIIRNGTNTTITTLAGTTYGYSGDGGPAAEAQFNEPHALALTPDGKVLYVADDLNNAIRRIDLVAGTISSLQPTDASASLCNNPASTPSSFCFPNIGTQTPRVVAMSALAVGSDNSLYLLDNGGTRLRRVDPTGMTVATIPLSAPYTLNQATGMAMGPDGYLYIADTLNGRILRVSTTGQAADIATLGLVGWETTSPYANVAATVPPTPLSAAIAEPQMIAFSGSDLYLVDGLTVKYFRAYLDGTTLKYAVSVLYGTSTVADCVGSVIQGTATAGQLSSALSTSLQSECPGRPLALAATSCTNGVMSLSIGQAYNAAEFMNGGLSNVLEIDEPCP